jgi:hypothetical protein
VVLLYIAETKMLAAGYILEGFLRLWCHIVEEAVGRFRGLVAEAAGLWDGNLWWVCRWMWVRDALPVCLIKQRLLPLFLMKPLNLLLNSGKLLLCCIFVL